jgi:glycine cleavage system aminomethyltransferase T
MSAFELMAFAETTGPRGGGGGSIKSGHHKQGTEIKIEVRNKLHDAEITKMPFVETKYYKG